MKNVLKAIGAGLALGGALFVLPWAGRVLVFVGLVRVASRLLGRGRGHRRWAGGGPGGFGHLLGAPVPIDQSWPRPGLAVAGPARQVPVS